MNGELLSLIETIVRDRGIDREVLIQAIESALASAAKKGVGQEEKEVTVAINRKTGSVSVTSEGKALASSEFSRIGAQMAKQVIMQKIREAERDVIFSEFQGKVGDLVSGSVHRFERGDIIVDLGRAEGILPKTERIPHEEYQQGDRLQAYVLDVRKGVRGTEIVLSRAAEGFIRGLFALEVPEISDGIVEIKAIAREAGDRTKIAVFSKDDKVDCVGACVGVRGTRVKNIVRELRGEKVDIIRWHEDIREFLAAALAPAKIAEIEIDDTDRKARVLVDDDQLSLAIGKKGQNVRLASKLTGWQLDIQSKAPASPAPAGLQRVKGIGPTVEERLKEAGITTAEQLAASTIEQLTALKGIGEKTAEKLLEAAKKALQEPTSTKRDAAPAVEVPDEANTNQETGGDKPANRPEPSTGENEHAGP